MRERLTPASKSALTERAKALSLIGYFTLDPRLVRKMPQNDGDRMSERIRKFCSPCSDFLVGSGKCGLFQQEEEHRLIVEQQQCKFAYTDNDGMGSMTADGFKPYG